MIPETNNNLPTDSPLNDNDSPITGGPLQVEPDLSHEFEGKRYPLMGDIAALYQAHGWVLTRIVEGRKRPSHYNWGHIETSGIDAHWEGGFGLLHGHSGTCAIDVDSMEHARAFLAERGVDLDSLFNAPDSVMIESGRKGHGKLLYALPFGEVSAKHVVVVQFPGDEKPKKHDVLNFRCLTDTGGTAMQDLLPPSMHPDGQRYRWAGAGNWRNPPPVPPELMAVWYELLRDGGGGAKGKREGSDGEPRETGDRDRDRAIEALGHIDPDLDREAWITIGMAFKAAGGELEDWDEWSSRGDKYQGLEDTGTRWASFDDDGGVGPGSLYHHAKEAGWVPPELRRPSIEEMFSGDPGEAPGCGVPPAPPMPAPADTPEAVLRDFADVTPQAGAQDLQVLCMRAALLGMTKLEIDPAITAIVQQKQFTRSALNAELKLANAAVAAESRRRKARTKGKVAPAPVDVGAGDDPVTRRFPQLDDPQRVEAVQQLIQHSLHCKANAAGDGEGDDPLLSVLPLVSNIETALLYGCGKLYPQLRFNDLRMTAETLDGAQLDDDFVNKLRSVMSGDFLTSFSKDDVHNMVQLQAKRSSYHPVRQYLAGLTWDGVPRVEDWAVRLLGAEDTSYHRAVGGILICGAVQRALRPGSKFDYMPILEGKQGATKSTILRALVPDDRWFLDITVDPRDLDKTSLALRGGLVMEVGELTGMGRADQSALKQWLTRTSDHFRAPYDRIAKDWPRQGIFVGTTNEDRYLTDTTGNRRFLPLECGQIDLDGLVEERDQLWAEAAFMMADAPSAWHLFQGIEEMAEDAQEDRREVDPGEELIAHYLSVKDRVTTAELCSALGTSDTTRVVGRRVRAIMRTRKDWGGPKKMKVGKISVRGYFRIGEVDENEINFSSTPNTPHGAHH